MRRILLISALLLLGVASAAGQADPNAAANTLFVQATTSLARAATAPSDDLATTLYRDAMSTLNTLQAKYGDTRLARQIAGGQLVGGFNFDQVTDPVVVGNNAMAPTFIVEDKLAALRYPPEASVTPGQVIFFKLADDPTIYARRLIALPGDTVQLTGGVVSINGVPVKREKVGTITDPQDHATRTEYRETLPNGFSYLTLDRDPAAPGGNTAPIHVPASFYFVIGDNRDVATDSRAPEGQGGLGFVPLQGILARAVHM